MDDKQILDLYWERSEAAISETSKKYGKYCRYIAFNILHNDEDSEECVNDTYLRAWNSIPPNRPSVLKTFLGKITRNLSLDRYELLNAKKRNGGQMPLVFDEIQECIPSLDSTENIVEEIALTDILNRFLSSLSLEQRKIFMRRYWYLSPIKEIATEYGMSESKIKMSLFRSRNELKKIVRERRYLCMKEKKLLRALGNVDNQYIKEAEPMKKTSKITNRQKWVSVAACFVLVAVIGVGVFQSNLFGTKNDIATLNDGETITFVKNDLSQSSINLNVTTRPLSDAEIEMLFADLPVTADAYFDADNHNILGFEGKIDDTRMVVSKQGVNLLDTIIDGNTITSSVDGVDINAGYFVTKSNSQGVKTVIYYATFDMGENTIYVEYSGVENESETVKNNLADTILKLIENGAFDLSQIQE